MNRAERRRIAKKQQKKEPIYNISQQNLNKIKQNAIEEAVQTAMILLLSLPIKVMNRHCGWGNKRLAQLGEWLTDAYQEFEDSGRSLNDEVEFIYQTTGIKFLRNPDA